MADSVDAQGAGGEGPNEPAEVALAPSDAAQARRRSRTLALWGVLAVIAVAAGAVVVGSAGDDDPPRLPIALGAGGDGAGRAESATASADMAMLAWITYVAGDDLPRLGDDGAAYKLSGEVTEDQVRELADRLGVDGDPTERDGVWQITGDGGFVEVYPGGGGQWWFSDVDPSAIGGGTSGSAGSAIACSSDEAECEDLKLREEAAAREAEASAGAATTLVEPCPPDADCDFPTPEPITPPEDLPSEAEARQIALDLFDGLGVDMDDAELTVDGPSDAWYVNVQPRIDGMLASGLYFYASVGSEGHITSAGGVLNTPERLGDYPVLDTHEAIDRLNEQQGAFMGGSGVGLAVDDGMCTAVPNEDGSVTEECAEVASEEPTTTVGAAGQSGCAVAVDEAGNTTEECSTDGVGVDCAAATDTTAVAAEAGEAVPTSVPLDAPVDPDTPVASDQPATSDVDPATDPATGCTPYYPPAEPTEVVLHEAEEILVLVGAFDESGDSYLVPGYRMEGDDGHVVEVAAVDDDSLLPPPIVIDEPQPGEPGTTDPGAARCAEIEPGPDGAVPEICLDPNSVPPAEPVEDLPAEGAVP